MDIWRYFKQKTVEENFGLKGTKSRNKERIDDNTFWDKVCTTCNMILQKVPHVTFNIFSTYFAQNKLASLQTTTYRVTDLMV